MVTWIEWQSLTALVVSITFGIISLAYAVGTGFHLPKLQAWAKNEIYQAFGSLFIAAMMFAIVEGINSTMNALGTLQPVACPIGTPPYATGGAIFEAVKCFMATLLNNFLSTLGSLLGAEIVLGLIASTTFKAQPYQLGISVSYGAGLAPITNLIALGVSSAAAGAWLMNIQLILLKLIENNILILFPIGIFLRAFPFSRAAGGSMMAIAIGLYVMYPSMWLFNAFVYAETGIAGAPAILTPQYILDCIHFNLMACLSIPLTIIPDIVNLIPTIAYNLVYNLFIYAVMLPLFNLIVTLIVINNLAQLLGGEIDIRGLTKII